MESTGSTGSAEREWVAEESVLVGAPVERVFALVADPRRTPELSPEVFRVWLRDSPVEEGSRFVGFNRRGPFVWFTSCEVTAHVPERVHAFRVYSFGMEVALWGYRLEPVGGSTRLTEYWHDLRRDHWSASLVSFLGRVFTGVRADRRAALNRAGMRTTLDRVRAALETPV
ncbi:SRPBCC family protein [Actinocorallia populi]|uniref:SRPBCC family protein n=1 Tax=Actinocorallia populi TaxID=2079200 RepID=UPI000D088AAD|nr:SRPBCC family protein [Actinocorallia populi]